MSQTFLAFARNKFSKSQVYPNPKSPSVTVPEINITHAVHVHENDYAAHMTETSTTGFLLDSIYSKLDKDSFLQPPQTLKSLKRASRPTLQLQIPQRKNSRLNAAGMPKQPPNLAVPKDVLLPPLPKLPSFTIPSHAVHVVPCRNAGNSDHQVPGATSEPEPSKAEIQVKHRGKVHRLLVPKDSVWEQVQRILFAMFGTERHSAVTWQVVEGEITVVIEEQQDWEIFCKMGDQVLNLE